MKKGLEGAVNVESKGNGLGVLEPDERVEVVIPKANFSIRQFKIVGTSPYVQNKFSNKARTMIMEKHKKGQQSAKGEKKKPRDFNEDYKNAMHIATEGWHGIPATGFRNAMIDSCRLVNFHMTKARQSLFILHDGLDDEGIPLIKISGKPEKHLDHVRNETGVVDIRCRPMWVKWECLISIRFDEDLFSVEDVANLLSRAGVQVGIGEGRPFSKKSNGCGWGTFELI